MNWKLSRCVFTVTFALAAHGALAGDAATLLRVQDDAPRLPPPSEQVPEKIKPDAGGNGDATLSEKLEKSDGVIKPPSGVDPEIKTIAPEQNPNSMPIIKPPGDAK